MSKSISIPFCFSISLLLTACSGSGPKFFVRNYENKPVSIQYTYFEKAEFSDTAGSDKPACNYVLISHTLLDKKIIKKYPYKTAAYFDTIPVTKLYELNYRLTIPAQSTIFITPIYNYGVNIKSVLVDDANRIDFMYDYPSVENSDLVADKLVVHHNSLLGNTYFLVDIKLAEIEKILQY